MTFTATNQPTIICSAEGSGTTLFRLLVDSHPEVTCVEGLAYVTDYVSSTENPLSIEEYKEILKTETVYSTSGFSIDDGCGSLAEAADRFLSQRMEASGKNNVAVLLHDNFDKARILWPKARFIHLVRDPRAVALNAKPLEWGGDVHTGVGKWLSAEQEWSQLADELDSSEFLNIHFEDLVTSHQEVMTRVFGFIGVPFGEYEQKEILSYVGVTDFLAPQAEEADGWRKTITDREIQMVEARVGDQLEVSGYELSGLPAYQVSDADLRKAAWANRYRKWTGKLKKHGLVAVVELFARKAGLESLHTNYKQKMNAHERAARKRSWREEGREYALAPSKTTSPSEH